MEQFGEVIESSLIHFVAQCWEWDVVPTYGSLVTIREDAYILFGILHQVQTGSIDAIRTPFAYRKTHEELKREQPHIFEFLKTTVSCSTLGYRQGTALIHTIPPQPPKIHAFVSLATSELACQFFASSDFLYLLFAQQGQIQHFDELLLAFIMQGMKHHYIDKRILHAYIEMYVLLTGNEYRRIKLFAQRLQHLIDQ